jgi:hypothetical protein
MLLSTLVLMSLLFFWSLPIVTKVGPVCHAYRCSQHSHEEHRPFRASFDDHCGESEYYQGRLKNNVISMISLK